MSIDKSSDERRLEDLKAASKKLQGRLRRLDDDWEARKLKDPKRIALEASRSTVDTELWELERKLNPRGKAASMDDMSKVLNGYAERIGKLIDQPSPLARIVKGQR